MTFSALEKYFKMREINLHTEQQNSNNSSSHANFPGRVGGRWGVVRSSQWPWPKVPQYGNPLVKFPL